MTALLPVYSKLCDRDPASYVAYCAAVVAANGSSFLGIDSECFRTGDGAGYGCSDHFGKRFVLDFASAARSGAKDSSVHTSLLSDGGHGSGDCHFGDPGRKSEASVIGFPDCGVDTDSSRLGGITGDEELRCDGDTARSRRRSVQSDAPVLEPLVGGVDADCGVESSSWRSKGPNGGVSLGRGNNYRKNQVARDRKRRQKNGNDSVVRTDLQKSSESKWQAQNRLAALKAEREIAILEATDLDEEKRKRRAQICAATERNLVSIEKYHSDLRKSGNTSSDDDTRVNTIFSAASISPSSSVSEAEIRKAKKDLEDAIADKEKGAEVAADREKKLSAALIRLGHSPEAIIGYGSAEVDIDAKTEWTVDSKDRITDGNEAILDIVYPDGYMVIHDDIDYVHPDGKRKVRLVGGQRFSVAEPAIDEVDYDAKSHWSLGSRNAISDEMAAKLFEKFPNGYKENYDSYSDAVTGKPRGVIRPTALPPRVF